MILKKIEKFCIALGCATIAASAFAAQPFIETVSATDYDFPFKTASLGDYALNRPAEKAPPPAAERPEDLLVGSKDLEAEPIVDEIATAEDKAAPKEVKEDDHAKKPFLQGWQFGAGLPLMMPMTGYNGFVGYVNKKSDGFWGKRVGGRLDFQIPSPLAATGKFVENSAHDGYDLNAEGKILFYKIKLNKIQKIAKEDLKIDDNNEVKLSGANAYIGLKNWNIGGLVDFYPFGDTWFLGGLRLTGGYYVGRMSFDLTTSMPENPLKFYLDESDTSPTSKRIDLKIPKNTKVATNLKWRYSGPYMGIGFDLGFMLGVKFYMDMGIVYSAPPTVSRGDAKLPTVLACYNSGSGCNADWIKFDLNSSTAPDVSDLTAQVLGQVIKGNVDVLSPATQAALAVELGDIHNGDYNQLGADIIYWLGDKSLGADNNAPEWLKTLLSDSIGDTAAKDALNAIKDQWGSSGSGFNEDLQQKINDAWIKDTDLTKINDAIRDFQFSNFMPIIKLGFMYRF